jgi:hypothetical protein
MVMLNKLKYMPISVSARQFLIHPIGLLRAMFIGDIVADVIAIFKKP